MGVKKGQKISLIYENREFEVIVIDPNGLGNNQPSIGFGYNMMEAHSGLPQSTITDWGVTGKDDSISLKLPSGKVYRVTGILGLDGNQYNVLEISDWVSIAADVIKQSRVKKSNKDRLVDFLSWFAVKGFYADAYTQLKGQYTDADSRAVSAWMQARLAGISRRNAYTRFLQEQGCEEWFEYANWTNYVYQGLFGMDKKTMVETWELVEGNKNIGRNYIPEIEGIKAVEYCEGQVMELFHDNLQQAHDDAIHFAKKKFKLDFS
jgi:hypothetical protein